MQRVTIKRIEDQFCQVFSDLLSDLKNTGKAGLKFRPLSSWLELEVMAEPEKVPPRELKEEVDPEKNLVLWENRVLYKEEGVRDLIKTMPELPQIGLFLFVNVSSLNLENISQYEVERMLLIPQYSKSLAVLMTSLLLTEKEKSEVSDLSPMSYEEWSSKLQDRVSEWYDVYYLKEKKYHEILAETGIEHKFWLVMGEPNPLKKFQFHELHFLKRIWILKTLCDTQAHNQESGFDSRLETNEPLVLGEDKKGSSYLYFSVFSDLRIYKQAKVSESAYNVNWWEKLAQVPISKGDEDCSPSKYTLPTKKDFELVATSVSELKDVYSSLIKTEFGSKNARVIKSSSLLEHIDKIVQNLLPSELQYAENLSNTRHKMLSEWETHNGSFSAKITSFGTSSQLQDSVESSSSPNVPAASLFLPSGTKISLEGMPASPERDKLAELLHAASQSSYVDASVSYQTLSRAVKNGETEKVLAALGAGLNPDHQMKNSKVGSFLHCACKEGHLSIVHLLVQAGAQLDIVDREENSPLIVAVWYGRNQVVEYLVKAGASRTFNGEAGKTALHLAANMGNLEACRHLLEGSEVPENFINLPDDGGWTPLMEAAEHRHADVVEFLLEKGADPHIEDLEKNVALHWATYSGSTGITGLLLDQGAELNCLNVHGDTPLHIAARSNHAECVTLLLSRGASTDIKNKAGHPALESSAAQSTRKNCGLQLESELQECPTIENSPIAVALSTEAENADCVNLENDSENDNIADGDNELEEPDDKEENSALNDKTDSLMRETPDGPSTTSVGEPKSRAKKRKRNSRRMKVTMNEDDIESDTSQSTSCETKSRERRSKTESRQSIKIMALGEASEDSDTGPSTSCSYEIKPRERRSKMESRETIKIMALSQASDDSDSDDLLGYTAQQWVTKLFSCENESKSKKRRTSSQTSDVELDSEDEWVSSKSKRKLNQPTPKRRKKGQSKKAKDTVQEVVEGKAHVYEESGNQEENEEKLNSIINNTKGEDGKPISLKPLKIHLKRIEPHELLNTQRSAVQNGPLKVRQDLIAPVKTMNEEEKPASPEIVELDDDDDEDVAEEASSTRSITDTAESSSVETVSTNFKQLASSQSPVTLCPVLPGVDDNIVQSLQTRKSLVVEAQPISNPPGSTPRGPSPFQAESVRWKVSVQNSNAVGSKSSKTQPSEAVFRTMTPNVNPVQTSPTIKDIPVMNNVSMVQGTVPRARNPGTVQQTFRGMAPRTVSPRQPNQGTFPRQRFRSSTPLSVKNPSELYKTPGQEKFISSSASVPPRQSVHNTPPQSNPLYSKLSNLSESAPQKLVPNISGPTSPAGSVLAGKGKSSLPKSVTITPVKNNAVTLMPVSNRALTVTPVNNSALTVKPVSNSALTVTPVNNSVLTVTPVNNSALTVMPFKNKALTVTPVKNNALTVLPVKNKALTVTPVKNNVSSATPVPPTGQAKKVTNLNSPSQAQLSPKYVYIIGTVISDPRDFSYSVQIANGTKFKLSPAQLEECLRANNGVMPPTLSIPVPEDVARILEEDLSR